MGWRLGGIQFFFFWLLAQFTLIFTLEFNITNVPIRKSNTGEMFFLLTKWICFVYCGVLLLFFLRQLSKFDLTVVSYQIMSKNYSPHIPALATFSQWHCLNPSLYSLLYSTYPQCAHEWFTRLISFGFFWGLFKQISSREEYMSYWALWQQPGVFQ